MGFGIQYNKTYRKAFFLLTEPIETHEYSCCSNRLHQPIQSRLFHTARYLTNKIFLKGESFYGCL
jgi:hypothetical protein